MKMVRRRTRSAMSHKVRKNTATTNIIIEAKSDVVSNDYLLDDEYHTSPKIKHCKSEKNFQHNRNTAGSPPLECITLDDDDDDNEYNNTVKSTVTVNNVNGNYTGTSRSRNSIRTLDNFFKINGPAKKPSSRMKASSSNSMKLCPTLSAMLPSPTNRSQQQPHNWLDLKQLPHLDCLYELSNDTNASEQTNLTDELPPPLNQKSDTLMQHSIRFNLANALNFINGTTTTVAGTTATTAAVAATTAAVAATTAAVAATTTLTNYTDNIFLQEPVLKLNIDKTPNQALSIKLNKSIEIEPKFASRTCPNIIEANKLQNCFNNGGLLNSHNNNCLIKIEKEEEEIQKKPITGDHADDLIMLPENDNSSCDSGVVFISSSSSSTIDSSNYNSSPPLEHKPTTPHRIVWPSPRREDSPDNTSAGLSPRKSQRHNNNTATCYAGTNGNNTNNSSGTATSTHRNRRKLQSQTDQKRQMQIAHTKTNDCQIANLAQGTSESDVNVKIEKRDPDNVDDDECDDNKKNVLSYVINQQQTKNGKNSVTGRPKCIVSKAQRAGINGNRSINEFFPVRRSARKTKSAVKEEIMRNLEKAILEEHCNGLKVEYFDGKGRGVVAERYFQRGEFVIEYIGDLISIAEATEREARYALDENAGCYMYYFEHKNQQYCIDATEDTGKLGRLVNHSRYGNLLTKVVVVKQVPHLVLIAKKDIKPGEELCYDYGDRSKDSLRNHPWLAL